GWPLRARRAVVRVHGRQPQARVLLASANAQKLLRRQRVRRGGDGASHPEKDDPGAKVAVASPFRRWNRLLGNRGALSPERGAGSVQAVERAEGAVDEPCWAVREPVRPVGTRRYDEAPGRPQGHYSLRVL